MMRKNIYIKDRSQIDMTLLIGNELMEKINMPFFNTDITLWKGIDNTIEFSVRNHDRKAAELATGSYLKFVAINDEMQQKIEKTLDVLNASTGRYEVSLSKKELNNVDCGTFIGHISLVDASGNEQALYTGTDWYPHFEVTIKPNKMNLLSKSSILEATDFNREIYQEGGVTYEKYTSSMLKSNVTASHTLVAQLKDFVGTFKVQCSNMDTPEHNEDDWFDIDSKSYTTAFTGTVLVNEEVNALWLRVQYIRVLNSASTLVEVSYRN